MNSTARRATAKRSTRSAKRTPAEKRASATRKNPAAPRWKPLAPEGLAEAVGPFSRAVTVDGLLWVAGTTALSHVSGNYYKRKLPRGIEAQTRLTLDNIRKTVEAAGGRMSDIFKVVIMLKNPADYMKMNAVRAEYFGEHKPISTCYQAPLMRPDILVEIEAVAALR